jgi:hypothetical protein
MSAVHCLRLPSHAPRLVVSALALFLGCGLDSVRAQSIIDDAILGGHFSIEARTRLEQVEQAGKNTSTAFTTRFMLGFETKPVYGLSGMIQLIDVADWAGDYNSLLNGKGTFAALPDPNAFNVNQAKLIYAAPFDTTVSVGRQIINLDNQRFVGNVDFRQTMQTFDAATVVSTPVPGVQLTGSYFWGIKDILNQEVRANTWLLEAAWAPMPQLQGEVFAYLYGNDSATAVPGAAACLLAGIQACNSQTYGGRLHGVVPLPYELTLSYQGTFAHQSSFDGGSALIDANYGEGSAKLAWRNFFAGFEYELLGSNGAGTYGFQTPLATKHLFNGWAEVFLTTPAKGLQSFDYSAGVNVFDSVLVGKYYQFNSDLGNLSYGHEWDASLIHQFTPNWSAGVEFADYIATPFAGNTTVNTKAGWIFATYRY